MGKFEIEVTLLSFIWAIAITHLLQAFRNLWVARARLTVSLSHLLWMAALLIGAVLGWLPLASLHGHLSDTLFICLLGTGFAMYFATSVASPEVPETGHIDLVAYEDRDGIGYKGAFIVMMILAFLFNMGAYATPQPWSWVVGALLPGVPAAIALVSLWRRERRVRLVCAVAVFVISLALLVLNITVN